MPYFNKQSLRRYADTKRNDPAVKGIIRKAVTDSRRARVFLSHSHSDVNDVSTEDIENIRVLFAAQGVDVYIDWLDPTMPSVTSVVTASRIKEKITGCDKFVVVATNNALRSRWVPWELGYADHAKGESNIAILPIADSAGEWNGSEYFRLYPRIKTATDNKPAVFVQDATKGYYLPDWLG